MNEICSPISTTMHCGGDCEQISLTAQLQKCDLLTAACLFSCAGQIVKEMLSTKSLRTRFITFIQDHGFMDTACCNSYDCLFQFQKKNHCVYLLSDQSIRQIFTVGSMYSLVTNL